MTEIALWIGAAVLIVSLWNVGGAISRIADALERDVERDQRLDEELAKIVPGEETKR